MDDQQTYLLNGLLTRQYSLGRIVRFRQVPRGRQATTFELLTAQQNEYLVYLLPPAFERRQLTAAATAIDVLDKHRFSVMPMLRSTSAQYVCEGPQGMHLMVGLAVVGSAFPSDQYTQHDVSQVGLRLAWMHRLMAEQLSEPPHPMPMTEQLAAALAGRRPDSPAPALPLPAFPAAQIDRLRGLLSLPAKLGWAHGDLQLAAMLMDSDHQLRTLTDWALLHWGHPLEDVVDVFLELCLRANHVIPGRGRMLLEAYDSLQPIRKVIWTAVLGRWLAQRLVDASLGRRALPERFAQVLATPEDMASAMASCLPG